MPAHRQRGRLRIASTQGSQNLLMLARGLLAASADGVDQVERIARPEDLHEMQSLRHDGDVIESAMKAIIDAACRGAIAAFEGFLEFLRKRAQVGHVTLAHLFY